MNFEIGGCGGQPSIHWAAAQTQSKQMSAGGLNNPNTAAEWKEEHLHNWNATVCSLSTNGEWAEWGLCHYRIWRSFLWAPGHSFNVKAKEHGLKLPFRFINLLIYIWNHYKASFLSTDGDCEDENWLLWVNNVHALALDFTSASNWLHKTFFKVSFLLSYWTSYTFEVQCKSYLERWRIVRQRTWKEHGKVPQIAKTAWMHEYHRSHW